MITNNLASSGHNLVRVFVSSTFHDMHAERDHLATVVFPELRERLARLGLDFFDVDLRWGLPHDNFDSESANSWAYCKRSIERVEPFFVCLLGQRYGWIPPVNELGDALEDQSLAGQSITEMEIRYALYSNRKRAYFYIRDTPVPLDAPTKVYSEFVDQANSERLAALKEEILHDKRLTVSLYSCIWTGSTFDNLEDFGRLVLKDLWFDILQNERYVPRSALQIALGFASAGPPHYANGLKAIPEEKWEAVLRVLERQLHDYSCKTVLQIDAVARSRTRWFQGRKNELEALTKHCLDERQPNSTGICVVIGPAGQGKSTLLAKLGENLQSKCNVITAFTGMNEQFGDMLIVLRTLHDSIKTVLALDVGEMPKDRKGLGLGLRSLLEKEVTGQQLVLIIDGMDELPGSHDLTWLPARLGRGISVVLSCHSEPASSSAALLWALQSRAPAIERIVLQPLYAKDVAVITRMFLRDYCKELNNNDIDNLSQIGQAKNPLYLLVFLHELRILGGNKAHMRVSKIIKELVYKRPDTMSLFAWFLENLEILGRDVVYHWCNFLTLGRNGLRSRELRTLVLRKLGQGADRIALRVERSMRRYLQYRGDRLVPFHSELTKAIKLRYHDSPLTDWHAELAALFDEAWQAGDTHALEELPYHLDCACRHDRLSELLTDLHYLHLRTSHGEAQVLELIDDYNRLAPSTTTSLSRCQDFISRHSDRLSRHPGLLFTLVQDEGIADLRVQADKLLATGQWSEKWMRTSSLPLPPSSTEAEEGARADVLTSCEYGPAAIVTLASQALLVMAVTRLGEVSVVDVSTGRILPAKIMIRRIRPLSIASSEKASHIAVAYDNGEVDVIRIDGDVGSLETQYHIAKSFTLRLPEYEVPFLAFDDHFLWYQQTSGSVARLNLKSGAMQVVLHADVQQSELAAVLYTDNSTLIVLLQPDGTQLIRIATDGAPITQFIPHATMTAACNLVSQRVALAFSNCCIVIYDLTTGIQKIAMLKMEYSAFSLTANANRVFWFGDRGRLHMCRLDGENATSVIGTFEGAGRVLAVDKDGNLLVAGELSAKHLNVTNGFKTNSFKILSLFGGQEKTAFFAFRVIKGRLSLLTNQSCCDNIASGTELDWATFAQDGRCHLLCVSFRRKAMLVEPLAPHHVKTIDLKSTPRAAAGAPEGGFWLLTETGDVVWLDLYGRQRSFHHCEYEVVGGFAIQSWPDILVWTTIIRFRNETVSMLSFTRLSENGTRQKKVATRIFKVRDGSFEAFTYDQKNDTLFMLWQGGTRGVKYLRSGSPEEFSSGNERVKELPHLHEQYSEAHFGLDGGLYLLTKRGALQRIDPQALEISAVLAPSLPLTHLAEQHSTSTLLLVRGEREVVSCVYEGVNHGK